MMPWLDSVTAKLISLGYEVTASRAQAKTQKWVAFEPLTCLEANFLQDGALLCKYQFNLVIRSAGQSGSVGVTTESRAGSPDAVWAGSLISQPSLTVRAQIVAGGARGTATVKFSADGRHWTTPVTTAASVEFTSTSLVYAGVAMAGTGCTLTMPAGTYQTGDTYTATYTPRVRDFDATVYAMGEVLGVVKKCVSPVTIIPVDSSDENDSGISNGNALIVRLEVETLVECGRNPYFVEVDSVSTQYPGVT